MKNDKNRKILPQHVSLAIKKMGQILITQRKYMDC